MLKIKSLKQLMISTKKSPWDGTYVTDTLSVVRGRSVQQPSTSLHWNSWSILPARAEQTFTQKSSRQYSASPAGASRHASRHIEVLRSHPGRYPETLSTGIPEYPGNLHNPILLSEAKPLLSCGHSAISRPDPAGKGGPNSLCAKFPQGRAYCDTWNFRNLRDPFARMTNGYRFCGLN